MKHFPRGFSKLLFQKGEKTLSHLRQRTLCPGPSVARLFIHRLGAHCAAACALSSPTQTHHAKNFPSIGHIALPHSPVFLVCNDQWRP